MSHPQATAQTAGNGEASTNNDNNNNNNTHIDYNAWQHMTRTVAHYERLDQIGEGTYGQVYRARCIDSGRIVALKKMRIHHGGYWGMPLQLIREVKILKRLQHPNLLQMIEVVTSKGVEHLDNDDPPAKNHQVKDKVADARESYKGNLFLVLEYVEHDLAALIDVAYQFTPVQIKCIFKQLLEALAFMHENKYVHRDIKSSNLLLDSNFTLKLADFGLARSTQAPLFDQVQERKANFMSGPEFTNKVITLWYRPPEILLGAVQYGAAVDVWSAGCILAELILGKPLFAAKTELDQLTMILEMLGPPPSKETYDFFETGMKKDTSKVPLSLSRADKPPGKLRPKYSKKIPSAALGLIEKMLAWDPRQRVTAMNALSHRYFWTDPVAPANPAELGETLKVGGPNGHFHEFQTKKKRKQARAIADEAKEKARLEGKTEEEAQAVHEKVYRKLMKKVVDEGLGANDAPAPSQTTSRQEDEDANRRDRHRRSSERSSSPGTAEGDARKRDKRSRDRQEDDSRRRTSRDSRSRRDAEAGRKRRRDDLDDSRRSRHSRERRNQGEIVEVNPRDLPRDVDVEMEEGERKEDLGQSHASGVVQDHGVNRDDGAGLGDPDRSFSDARSRPALPGRENRYDRDPDRTGAADFQRDRSDRDRPPFPGPDRRRGPDDDRPPYDDSEYRRDRQRHDDRDRFREPNERERPARPDDVRGRDRPSFDDQGPLDGRLRDRRPDDRRAPFDDRGPSDGRGVDGSHERPPFDDRGPSDGRRRDRPPFDDRGPPDGRSREGTQGRPNYDDRGPPDGRGSRGRPMGRPQFDDRGPPGRRGRDRPTDRPFFDDRGPPDGRGRDRPPLDDRVPREGRGRQRPVDRSNPDDRGLQRDMPPLDDRGRSRDRPNADGRERPRDSPPFERDGLRDRQPVDEFPRDRERRRMGPPPDNRARARLVDFPPVDERDMPRDRPPPFDGSERARRPPYREDRGRYGPSGYDEEKRMINEPNDRADGDLADHAPNEAIHRGEHDIRPERQDDDNRWDRSDRRSGGDRRRKKDKKRRDRSRSRGRHDEPRRKDRVRDERGRADENPDYYGPPHGQESERRREDRQRHDDRRDRGDRRDRHDRHRERDRDRKRH